jgi:hypothetical protein
MSNPLTITKKIGEAIGNKIADSGVADHIPDALVVDVPDIAGLADATTYTSRVKKVGNAVKTQGEELVEKIKGVEEDSILNQKPLGLEGYTAPDKKRSSEVGVRFQEPQQDGSGVTLTSASTMRKSKGNLLKSNLRPSKELEELPMGEFLAKYETDQLEAKQNDLQSSLIKNYNARKSKGGLSKTDEVTIDLDNVSAGSDSADTELNSNYTEDVEDDIAEEDRLEREAEKKLQEGFAYEKSSSSDNSDDEDV